MRKVLFCLLLGLANFARGQDVSGTITATGCLAIDAKGGGVVGISVTNSGTAWSGTIQPQIAIGGDPAQNTTVTPYSSSTAQATITANGIYNVNVSGGTVFLLCGNTVTNIAGIKMNVVHLSGRLGAGSGSGSGTVSANSGAAGAEANYAAAGGSTTVGPDASFKSNGAGTLTLGGAGLGTAAMVFQGNSSGNISVGCNAAVCQAFGSLTQGAAFKNYNTAGNCAAVGTTANPSAVACGSNSSGSFSCSPTASAGTCVVAETGVTANSVILVTPVAASQGLTCNATADTGLSVPRVLSSTAATGFTISLGTFTTTAECFTYFVIN